MFRKPRSWFRWSIIAAAAFFVAPLANTDTARSPNFFSKTYDIAIKKSAEKYLPEYTEMFGYEILKAQLYQESQLKPYAVSPVGAKGLGQFMPGTWDDVSEALNFESHISVFSADDNIEASAYYMSYLLKEWHRKRPLADRYSLALASYNAGVANILKAQRLCGYATAYRDIMKCLPGVTGGSNSRQTMIYVENVWAHWWHMRIRLIS